MSDWISQHADAIAARAPRELEALVAVSSPSGDVHGAEEAAAVAAALAPDEAEIERLPCSSAEHAPDLLVRIRGTGAKRILLLGHIDHDIAEAALLLVCDEEWRIGQFAHVERFAGYDACLCFEGGQRAEDGREQVIVKRKAAATVHVTAAGRSAHSGSAPHRGINALLALAGAAQVLAEQHDPDGEEHLTVVPTVIRSGDAFNVVPDSGELVADVRADTLDALRAVVGAVPPEIGGASLEAVLMREWPGMDSRAATASLLERAGAAIGRPIVGARRGGASDASHFAPSIPLTVDGLGPLGGGAHAPHEFVLASGLRPRAEVALAIVDAVLAG
jgi:glutamate carboxypeptidase